MRHSNDFTPCNLLGGACGRLASLRRLRVEPTVLRSLSHCYTTGEIDYLVAAVKGIQWMP